ncbi:hypothetical protein ACN38_g1284 [Penicillium nordicum]|uniref:Uncharacterized protein n=1 Tax=Penicillium nordicum TaxID=229535 RepID=A0A0M8P993_9EURO|nr:hypothetical protein ACN38_g1284 [Penicillium nordicum]
MIICKESGSSIRHDLCPNFMAPMQYSHRNDTERDFHAEPHYLPRTLSANQNDRLPSSRPSPTPTAVASIVSLLESQVIWQTII